MHSRSLRRPFAAVGAATVACALALSSAGVAAAATPDEVEEGADVVDTSLLTETDAPEAEDEDVSLPEADEEEEESGARLAPAVAPLAADVVDIRVLTINDFHGRIQSNGAEAGAAVLAGAVAQYKSANPNTLFVSAGDNIGASTFPSFIQDDTPTIDALRTAGLDLSAVGNHEFDQGYADLVDRVLPGYGGNEFGLGANVTFSADGSPALQPYVIKEVAGVRVGFIGTVTQDTPSMVTPTGVAGLAFGNQLEAVERYAAEIADETDIIIVLAHDGPPSTNLDTALAAGGDFMDLVVNAPASVDAIVSGHTHVRLNWEAPVGTTGETRPVIQAHQYGTLLGSLNFSYDRDAGELLDITPALIELAPGGTAAYPASPAVASLVATAVAEANVLGAAEVGAITASITRARTASGAEDRGAESTLGNLVADVYLWATSNPDYAGTPAQIGMMNPGGLRADLNYGTDGTMTVRDVANVQPFANTLVTVDLTGAQIKEILEQQWQPAGSSRPYLQLGLTENFSYTFNPDAPAGERIVSVSVDGTPILATDVFTVVTNSFLAAGGDNFFTFADGTNRTDTGQVDLAASVAFFDAQDEPVAPPALGRGLAVDSINIDVLTINDFHGRIQPNGAEAGAAVLAGAVATFKASNAYTLFVSAGDNIGASTFPSFIQDDTPTIDALRVAGLDLAAVGNHEFDQGYTDLVDRVLPGYGGDEFGLGANVTFEDGRPALQPYVIKEVAGVRVGFIGVVTQDTPSMVTPTGVAGLVFGDQLEAVNRYAAEIADDTDIIIVLSHDGPPSTNLETALAEGGDFMDLVVGAPATVDAIVSGHTHVRLNWQAPVGTTGETRPVIQAHQYGTTLGHLSFEVDPASKALLGVTSALVPLVGTVEYPSDAAVAEIVADAVAEADVLGSVPVGAITESITRAKNAAGTEDRGAESTLGNLVADIYLWATSNPDYAGTPAQIGMMNPGGLRADLIYEGDGTVTVRDVANVQPFANTLVTVDLTGAQIKEILEQQWQPDGSSRPYLQLGLTENFSYEFNPDNARGERIVGMTFEGNPIADDEVFTVVTNSFLGAGGDNFFTFAQGVNRTDTGQVDLAASVAYFAAQDGPVAPPALGRGVQVTDPVDPTPTPEPTDPTPEPTDPAPGPGDKPGDGSHPATGSELPWGIALAAAAVIALGGLLVATRRRSVVE